jgi:hypothetical protein
MKLGSSIVAVVVAAPALAVFPDNPDTGGLFPFVGKLGQANAVAINPYWAITVAHVGGMQLNLEGTTYTAVESITHPTADLRLLRFDTVLPHTTSIYYGPILGQQVALAGHGQTAEYTTTGWNFLPGTEGIRRVGFNTITNVATRSYSGYTVVGAEYTVLAPGQGGIAPWDSGSGFFVDVGGQWHLAAVSAYIFGPGGNANVWGAGGGGVYLTEYESWINATVPEPATLAALGAGLALLLRRRRR